MSPGFETQTYGILDDCSVLNSSCVFVYVFVAARNKERKKERKKLIFVSLIGFPVIFCVLTIPTVSHSARSVPLKDTSQLFNALGMNSDHCINF